LILESKDTINKIKQKGVYHSGLEELKRELLLKTWGLLIQPITTQKRTHPRSREKKCQGEIKQKIEL
jgi:hypothetical protein